MALRRIHYEVYQDEKASKAFAIKTFHDYRKALARDLYHDSLTRYDDEMNRPDNDFERGVQHVIDYLNRDMRITIGEGHPDDKDNKRK
ncbi:hypothetical protein [Rhodococcus qingshengii]|uniref:hypothetical protein n=1 Tax=Rhodococcus qingshengii TaxID=334542 RepID=UPI0035DC7F26